MPQSGTLPNLTGHIVDDGRLELVKIIGAGAYGQLYKARNLTTTSTSFYAVKCLRRPALSSADAKFQDRERALHRRVSRHPNIVTFHGHFVDPEHVFLVMDLCVGGDMYGAILDGVYHRQTALIKRTFADLVDGVRFCHSHNVYHRDLKPENILVDYDGRTPLIADFGLCTEAKTSRDMDCGSGSYMCPESFSSASSSYYPQYSDTWALCIVLINMVTAMNPWRTAEAGDMRWNSFMADPDYLREILPISHSLNELLTRCFRIDPARRPTLTQLRHEVLNMRELFMSESDLKKASPGVRRAAGRAVPEPAAYEPDDCSEAASNSGSGYSSLDANIGRPLNFSAAPAGLVPPEPVASGSHLTVPASQLAPSASKVPFASHPDFSSEPESEGPLTPQDHLVQLPFVSDQDPHAVKATPGKFRRFMRRLRVWRRIW